MLHAIAGALAHSVWQGGLAALAVVVLDAAVARDRAAFRHAVRVLALAAWLLAFVVQVLGGVPAADDPSAVAGRDAGDGAGLGAWLSAAWICGVGIGALRIGVGAVELSAWRRAARPVSARIQAEADALARELGVRAVRVAEHAAIAVPCMLGVLCPIVLLPVGLAAALPPAVLRTILVHELVHLRRFDPWINALVVLATILFFHHPAAWWLARQIRAEREHACDAEAAPMCGGALAYARALVDIAALLPSLRTARPVGIPVVAGEGLRARVTRLLPGGRRPSAARGRWLGALAVVLTLAILPTSPVEAHRDPSLGIAWLPPAVRRHETQIVEAARRHGVDPDLLAIVVLVESGGNPRATSPVGARGLMQLMPRTAAELAGARAMPPLTAADLHDPRTSLDLGADYLARQMRAFAGLSEERRIELAAAAYNGGPSRARAWQSGDALPEETERYRRLVGALWRERHLPVSPTLAARRVSH
jgi:beta-lactamase regulating signal transducer with metallopeptidase domain